jgi:hypothetical protein
VAEVLFVKNLTIQHQIEDFVQVKPLTRKFITNRAYKKYLKVKNESQCTLNHKAIAKEIERDGFFGIITNVKEDVCSRDSIEL